MSRIRVDNHIILEGADIFAVEYICETEIVTPQHRTRCNFDLRTGKPKCKGCLYAVYDLDADKTYCSLSRRK